MRVTVLAGGVGAARFLQGLVEVVPPNDVTAVVNTGDDAEFYGLHVSPDLDIVMYTLAGLVDPDRGWGVQGDTFACLELLGRYGAETWFQLGDRDLATHILRTQLLAAGQPLSAVTDHLRRALGIGVQLLPMSDHPARTHLVTDAGTLPFQQYFVQRGQRDAVRAVQLVGIEDARPAPGVLEAIAAADAIVIAPSNPLVSIGPILAVAGVRTALAQRRAATVAISPIIGGATVKGPAAAMLRDTGREASAVGVAGLYRDVASVFILDQVDAALAPPVADLGLRPVAIPTLMVGPAEKRSLAQQALRALGR